MNELDCADYSYVVNVNSISESTFSGAIFPDKAAGIVINNTTGTNADISVASSQLTYPVMLENIDFSVSDGTFTQLSLVDCTFIPPPQAVR